MIFITKNIHLKETSFFKKTKYLKRYSTLKVWFLFILVYYKQYDVSFETKVVPMNFDIDSGAAHVYNPTKDEGRIMEGKEEVNFE